MDFRYKAKVDKKWLKGRSLTDHKEDATEFESESEPTQIINQLKRNGKIAQKAVIKIIKKRESIEANNNFKNLLQEGENMLIFENSESLDTQSKMKVEEGLFTPKSWSAKGIEKAKKEKSKTENTPHRYSVHIKNLSTEQLFGLYAMNNIKNDVEFFGFGIVKIRGRFYLYKWSPTECDWAHPKMGMNILTYESRDIHLCLLSTDFTDEMADDLSQWIENKEAFGTCSGRVWPIFASAATESSDAKYEGVIVFGDDKSSINKYKKIYDKLTNGKNALPIERGNLSGDISEIPNKFQNGAWLSVKLDPKEIMSLGIGQKDIYDDTLKKNYGEITINDLHESKNLGININYSKIYREAAKKEFGPTHYKELYWKYFEKNCDAKNGLEESFYDYISDVFKFASKSDKKSRFNIRKYLTDPASLNFYNEEYLQDYPNEFREFIKDPVKNSNLLKDYLDNEDIPAWDNLKNLFLDDASYSKYEKSFNKAKEAEIERARKDEEEWNKKVAPIVNAISSVGLDVEFYDYFNSIEEFALTLNTEDEYDAENARDEIAKVLNGAADNAYGASYDDIEGMGNVHLGCMQYYEFSEMNGSDTYEDLDKDIRNKYVIFACPKEKWINYRRMTDY